MYKRKAMFVIWKSNNHNNHNTPKKERRLNIIINNNKFHPTDSSCKRQAEANLKNKGQDVSNAGPICDRYVGFSKKSCF